MIAQEPTYRLCRTDFANTVLQLVAIISQRQAGVFTAASALDLDFGSKLGLSRGSRLISVKAPSMDGPTSFGCGECSRAALRSAAGYHPRIYLGASGTLCCRHAVIEDVSKDGNGLLTVELGWVAFERNNVESFIPAGAACVTRPGKGPGTPYFSDAPGALTNALARFDTSADAGALDAAIASARQRDALSLWHLMVRTHGDQRARVYDRFASLVSLPQEATREAVVRGDGKALDAAWDALDLGNTDWWREWKRRW